MRKHTLNIIKVFFTVFLPAFASFFFSCNQEVTVTDTTPPAAVTELSATPYDGYVVLSWKDPADTDLLGIEITYSTTSVSTSSREVKFEENSINVAPGKLTVAIGPLENGTSYLFLVKAFDTSYNRSSVKTVASTPVKSVSQTITKTVTKYVCPNDKKEYDTAEEAAKCCGVQKEEVIKEVEVVKEIKKYICPNDKKEYDTAEKAAECCGVQTEEVIKEIKKYICPNDNKEFDTAEEAANCCGVQIETITKYVCSKCAIEYDTLDKATSCFCKLAEIDIDGATNDSWAFYTKEIDKKNLENIKVTFSVDMAVVNNTGKKQKLLWQVNTGKNTYPIVASKEFDPGVTEWTTVSGSKSNIAIGDDPIFYLATVEDKAQLKIYLKNLKLSVIDLTEITWLSDSVPSLKETYKDIFDYFGIAAEYGNFGTGWGTPNEFYYEEVQNGIAKHANSITMGNEFKPQFIMAWWGGKPQLNGKFTASNGVEIDTPVLKSMDRMGSILEICKNIGIQMRGHVLVWHSQTDDNFFAEDYEAEYDDASAKNVITNKVTKEVMDARLEWYIKTVLEYVDNWEKTNNGGKHIIWAWDVVNEAMADDANVATDTWVRGSTDGTKDKNPNSSGSRWYQVYGSQEFIINAFRYANKYAPSDVKLCYNDYNEYMGNKTEAILKIIEEIKSHESDETLPTRFDVMAMQSHVGATWPGVNGYEDALKLYLAAGVDVHVSELDLGTLTDAECAALYADYFKMLKKYGTGCIGYDGHKITNVTIWGVNDENSWINPNNDGNKASPLLFSLVDNVSKSTREKNKLTFPLYDVGDTYIPKDAFWSVINAATAN